MAAEECQATVELATGATLTCNQSAGHPGPVHDDHGHQWGDTDLPSADEPA